MRYIKKVLFSLPLFVGCASIPNPAGPYTVGTYRFDFAVNARRTIEIRAWYPSSLTPAVHAKAAKEPAFEPALAQEAATTFGMPKFAFGDDSTGAAIDAPAAAGSFPVLIFNHGFASFGKQNASQFEDLAANGYVVFSLSHPGDSLLTTYNDGHTVAIDRSDPAYLQFKKVSSNPKPALQEFARTFSALRNAADDQDKHRQLMQGLSRSPVYADYEPVVERWVTDTRAVLSSLTAINQDRTHPLAGHLAPSRVGLFGHSMGGVIAGRVAQLDERAGAAMSYDAPQFDYTDGPEPPRQRIPTCFLYADTVAMAGVTYSTAGVNDALFATAPGGSCTGLVRGSAHYNFSDMNNTALLRFTPMLGEVNNRDMANFLRRFTRAYFDHHLSGAARPSPDQDLVVLRWRPTPDAPDALNKGS